jgi:hypothetical protein
MLKITLDRQGRYHGLINMRIELFMYESSGVESVHSRVSIQCILPGKGTATDIACERLLSGIFETLEPVIDPQWAQVGSEYSIRPR